MYYDCQNSSSSKISPSKANGAFAQICQDILASETSRVGSKTNQERVKKSSKRIGRKILLIFNEITIKLILPTVR